MLKTRDCLFPLGSNTCYLSAGRPTGKYHLRITSLDQVNADSEVDAPSSLQVCGDKILAFSRYQAVCNERSVKEERSRSSRIVKP